MAVRRPQKQVALLPHAYTPELGNHQKHYVAYPVESGPQACLIETKNDAGLLEIVDALTIVPVNVSVWHSSVEDPLYGCWLGVIAGVYKKDIAARRKMWTFDPLATKNERQPPFRPVRHGNLVEFAQKLLDEWSPVDSSTPDIFNHSTWLGFKDTLKDAYCWYTRHVKMHEASKLCVEQWRILSMWESWEQPIRKKMSWGDRWMNYCAAYPARPPHIKRRGLTTRTSPFLGAFKKRCSHMGLKQGEVPRERLSRENLRKFAR